MFGARDLGTVEAWRLKDDIATEHYGGSWLTDARNNETLLGSKDALLKQIECRADLRRVFIRDDEDDEDDDRASGGVTAHRKKRLCPQACLKSLVPLLHITPMPLLRPPEFLTMTYTNSGSRRRSLLLWEQMLMVYVRYHKS